MPELNVLGRNGPATEWAVGVFLLLAFATLGVLALSSTDGRIGLAAHRYVLMARFGNVGELRVHAPVKISGVKVGEVADIELDAKTDNAIVTLALEPKYGPLPADSSARILTAGLLGERYVGLAPGGDPATLPSGSDLVYSQDAIVLEDLIGKFVFGAGGQKAPTPAATP